MINRKILYGYRIQNGEISVCPPETAVVNRITTLYLAGASYQKIADALNADHILFSTEAPLWNKHKVKRLLENPRYTGTDGYPAIITEETFRAVQAQIQSKAAACTPAKSRPALRLKEYLRCEHCGCNLHRTARANRRPDTLYLKCGQSAGISCRSSLSGCCRGILSLAATQVYLESRGEAITNTTKKCRTDAA